MIVISPVAEITLKTFPLRYESDVKPLWDAYDKEFDSTPDEAIEPRFGRNLEDLDVLLVSITDEVANEFEFDMEVCNYSGLVLNLSNGKPEGYRAFYAELKERLAEFPNWVSFDS